MAVRDIVLYPDPPLKEVAAPFAKIGSEVAQLARDMFETMRASEGVGLAGPQIGISRRILVLGPPDGEEQCLVNPELSEFEGRVAGEEGCLSLPRVYGMVPRAERVHVKAFDEQGAPLDFTAEGFVARIIQHECDHLEGKVFPDRMDLLSREDALREWAEKKREWMAAIGRV